MTRAYGRCPTNRRLIGRQPFGHWKTTTFIAGLRCDAITAPFVLDGAMDRAAFTTYIDQVQGVLGKVQDTVNEVAVKREALRRVLAR